MTLTAKKMLEDHKDMILTIIMRKHGILSTDITQADIDWFNNHPLQMKAEINEDAVHFRLVKPDGTRPTRFSQGGFAT